MQSTTLPQSTGVAPPLPSPTRYAIRWLILGLVTYIYTLLGAQTRTPPTLLPIQGAMFLLFCAWWIWKIMRRQGLPRSPLTVPVIALLGAATLSTAFSIDQRISFEGLLACTALVLYFLLVCDMLLVNWHPQTFVNALLFLATLILAQSLVATAQWYWNWYAIRVPEYPPFLIPYRITEVASHPNALAALINMALPFGIVRLAEARKKRVQLGWGLWLLAANVTLFFARSRGGWIATIVVLICTVGWLMRDRLIDGAIDSSTGALGFFKQWSLSAVLKPTWPILATTAVYVAVFVGLYLVTNSTSPSGFTTNGSASGEDRFRFWAVAWQDFRAHPITGSGLVTFGRVYTGVAEAIRVWLPVHAHNLYIDTLAQQGTLGALALGWVLVVGIRTFLTALNTRQPLLLCVCAALAGCLIHSLFDVVTALPTNALIVVVLAAIGMHAAGALSPARSVLSRWTLTVLATQLILAAVLYRQNAGYEAFVDAILRAQRGNWATSAQKMDRAVALDPNVAFYYGQRGYAYGVLAAPSSDTGDPQALQSALASYATALRVEPDYVPNLLNAATLLSQAGAASQAEPLIQAALPHGRDWALPTLLLAERASNAGQTQAAETLFAAAFQRESQARKMAVCLRNAACRTAAQRLPSSTDDFSLALTQARALLAQGQSQQALAILQRIPIANTDPQPWLYRADAYLAIGQLPQARYCLRIAEALGASNPTTLAQAVSSFARFYLAQAQPAEAISVLEYAARPQISGQAYSFFVFRRPGLPGLLLPRLDLLQRTSEDLAVYRQLAQLYAKQGRSDDAAWAVVQGDALEMLLRSDR